MDRAGKKVTFRSSAAELPVNAMIAFDSEPEAAWLVQHDCVRRWTPAGYTSSRGVPDEIVTVLTRRSTVQVLTAGFVAEVHPSALMP